jgi:hypothetical protein
MPRGHTHCFLPKLALACREVDRQAWHDGHCCRIGRAAARSRDVMQECLRHESASQASDPAVPLFVSFLLRKIKPIPYSLGRIFPGILCNDSKIAPLCIPITPPVNVTLSSSLLSLSSRGSQSMCPSEIPEPADSGAMGFYAVLMRVHEPLLASIFWLALGCVLGWPTAECVVPRHAQEGECERGLQKPRSGIARHEAKTHAHIPPHEHRTTHC